MSSSIFGPVLSRRFGLSLGVDVVGEGERKCNYDCLYCELAKAPKTSSLASYKEPQIIAEEIKEALLRHPDIDFITVTANGEPTLYPKLCELISLINGFKGGTKTLILSNGSTICDKSVREALKLFDVVKLSLDSGLPKSFKKIDRALQTEPIALIECMSEFRKEYDKTLALETLFVKGVNDSAEDVRALNDAYLKIMPDRIDLSTIDRPPAYNVQKIDEEELRAIASSLSPTLKIAVASRKIDEAKKRRFSEEEILFMLKNRPFSLFDIETLYDDESRRIFENAKEGGKIKCEEVAGVKFYWSF